MNTPDIEDLKRLRRMGRRMVSTYIDSEKMVAKVSEGLTLSCKQGCAGCCYQLVLASLPEAVAVAEYFLSNVQRRGLIPDIMRSLWAQLGSIEGANIAEHRQNYFQKKQACVFLVEETKLCSIYPVRPAACRHHFVVSDPALCQPEAGMQEVGRVNASEAELQVLSEANRVSRQTKLPLYVGPFQVVLLWAFKLLIEGRPAFEAALNDPELGVMDLKGWQARFGPAAFAEESETLPETPETQGSGTAP